MISILFPILQTCADMCNARSMCNIIRLWLLGCTLGHDICWYWFHAEVGQKENNTCRGQQPLAFCKSNRLNLGGQQKQEDSEFPSFQVHTVQSQLQSTVLPLAPRLFYYSRHAGLSSQLAQDTWHFHRLNAKARSNHGQSTEVIANYTWYRNELEVNKIEQSIHSHPY